MDDMDNIKFEPLTPPGDVANNSALLMKKLAEDAPLDGINIDSDKLISKAKLFIVAQACNELNRVIKMTNFLDTLEEKFMDTVNSKLEENPQNLQLITYAMETITESLNRSNNLITQILKDEKLASVIINTTNIITPDGSSATVMSMDSRDTVRNWASAALAQLKGFDNNSSTDIIIDESVNDESEQEGEQNNDESKG